MKLPLFAAIAFVIGLAAATGVTAMRPVPPAKGAVADSSHAAADSTAAPHGTPEVPGTSDAAATDGHADSTHEVPAPPATGPKLDASTASATPATEPVPATSGHATTTATHATAPAAGGTAATNAANPKTATPVPTTREALEVARDAEGYKQVARILGNMKPQEAASIMGYLTDDQVEGILRSLGVRSAAVMLAKLPTERAAALSRRLLVSEDVP